MELEVSMGKSEKDNDNKKQTFNPSFNCSFSSLTVHQTIWLKH